MSPPRRRPPPPLALPLLVLLPLVLLLAACQAGSTAGGRPTPLRDLHGIAELQQAFNADAGKPRLILLLSPT